MVQGWGGEQKDAVQEDSVLLMGHPEQWSQGTDKSQHISTFYSLMGSKLDDSSVHAASCKCKAGKGCQADKLEN
jgi:hypothetical protein